MPLSGPLFERSASAPPVPRGLPLVVALTGFTDAGSAVSRIVDYFRDDLVPTPLALSFAHDALGQPFLLLAGYEPDFGWDAFTATVLAFVEDYGVSTVTWVHAIPMPVPHTRPIGT